MLRLCVANDQGYGDEAIGAVKVWKFPCGEVGVKLDETLTYGLFDAVVGIRCDFESNDDLIALGQLVDAINVFNPKSLSLAMPYFPYARQDRRCNPGEGHALKMIGSYINSLNFTHVIVKDAHSTVLSAVVDRLHDLPQEWCAKALPKFDFLVSPDAGAEKKVFKHAQVVDGGTQVLTAHKRRSPDGKITDVYVPDVDRITGKRVCVVDDLCDGGATFHELGRKLIFEAPAELSLYITHGMFTKGLDELLKIYDNIYVSELRDKTLETSYTGRLHII